MCGLVFLISGQKRREVKKVEEVNKLLENVLVEKIMRIVEHLWDTHFKT